MENLLFLGVPILKHFRVSTFGTVLTQILSHMMKSLPWQNHRYLGSVIFAFEDNLTMTLSHKTRFNTSGQGFEKDPIRYQCY